MNNQSPLLIEIATRDVTCLPLASTIGEAARIMAQHRFSSIVVTSDAHHPVGIITERNILHAMRSGLAQETPLHTCMSSPVVDVPSDASILDAYQICLREGIRHLVLVDATGAVAGVVSETDFRMHLNLTALAGRRQVIAMAQQSVTSLPVHSSLMQALNLMQAQSETCVVVVEDGKPVGIITERDVVRFYAREPDRVGVLLREVMTAPVLSIAGDASVNVAAELMLETRVRHLAVTDATGRLIGLLSEHDLTRTMALGQLDERLEVDEIFLRTFLDNIPDLVWLKDREGVYLTCNRRFEQFFGAKEKDIVGKTDYDFVEKEEADFFREHDRKSMAADGPSVNDEWLTFAADGYHGLFETIKSPMRDSRGKLIGVLGVARDITERERTKRALAVSEREFRTLADNLPDNIIRYDRECRVRYMNPVMALTIAPELLPILDKLPYESDPDSEQVRGLQHLVEQVIDSGKRVELEFEILHPDRTMHWHHVIFVPERDEDGKVIGALGIGRDISERKLSADKLAKSEYRYRTLVENSPFCIHEIDLDGRLQSMNRAGLDMMGLQDESGICGVPYMSAVSEQDRARIGKLLQDALGGSASHFEFAAAGDVPMYFKSCFIPIKQSDGKVVELMGLTEDVTQRKNDEKNLRIIASVFDNTREAIIITDAGNRIIDVNPAFSSITGYSREEVLGKNPGLLNSGRQDQAFYETMWAALKQDKAWRGEIWNRRKSGEIYAELLSVSAICDEGGRVQRYVAVFSDITYFKDHEAELSHVANYDALTGVPNRRLLGDRMGQAIVHAQRTGTMLAVCYIDLDGFKAVNDQYGHETGDLLLVAITRRLQEVLRAGDTLARLGGDEFVVLFNDLAQEVECLQVLERMVQTIAMPILIDGHQLTVSASIGVTFYPSDEEDGDTLLRHADQAMYAAKQAGKNRYHLYDPVHDKRVRTMHESRKRILQGLDAGEFELFYQPKLEFATGHIVGAEALIRWHHPERGLLLPGEFLPAIENSELEIRLGNWVMDTALVQLHAWHKTGMALEVSINISARHLQAPDFVSVLQDKLARHAGLPRGSMQIEVLETAALEDIGQTAEVIEACRKLGVSFALDDFGTGYSSLSYLRRLSADTLKIDQSFVRGMLQDEGDSAIVQGVIALARSFGRKTVAEGMEDEKLAKVLAGMGCGFGQGYSIARPMPATDFTDWYRRRKTS